VTQTPERKKADRGRPRSGETQRPDLTAADQILDASARLFAERGYAATSTRAIAEQVGIRQASLYYHFPSKEQILEVLLMRTVEPSTTAARYLDAADADAPVRLWALIAFDTRQLFTAPHNVGALYLLPEIRNDLFAPFRDERARLRELYSGLITASITARLRTELGPAGSSSTTASLDYLVDVVFGLVESVISIRADRERDDGSALVTTIAQSCLRALGHDGEELAAITNEATGLLDAMAASVGQPNQSN
jgi:AcrR family transcriptional regulator